MLKHLGIENYRSFQEWTEVEFAPLTIFVGPNNSGKSSLINLIRMLFDNPGKLPWLIEKESQSYLQKPVTIEVQCQKATSNLDFGNHKIRIDPIDFKSKFSFEYERAKAKTPAFFIHFNEVRLDAREPANLNFSAEKVIGGDLGWNTNATFIDKSGTDDFANGFGAINFEQLFSDQFTGMQINKLIESYAEQFISKFFHVSMEPILFPKEYSEKDYGVFLLEEELKKTLVTEITLVDQIQWAEDNSDSNGSKIHADSGLFKWLAQFAQEIDQKYSFKTRDKSFLEILNIIKKVFRITKKDLKIYNYWQRKQLNSEFLNLVQRANAIHESKKGLDTIPESELFFEYCNLWLVFSFLCKVRRTFADDRQKKITKIAARYDSELNIFHLPAHREGLLQDSFFKREDNDLASQLVVINTDGSFNYNLVKWINLWMKAFELGIELHVDPLETSSGRQLFDFYFKEIKTERIQGLQNVGYGISQVLPIIMAQFQQGKILVEQPESQLHPAVQSRLAALFAHMIKDSDRQVIVETHSEYLIRKLQVLVAKGTLSPDQIAINYIDRDESGISRVKKLRMGSGGAFLDPWPSGFFDESTDLAIEFWEVGGHKN